MSEWMDKFLDQRQKQKDAEQNEMMLLALSKSVARQMFGSLLGQMVADAKDFMKGTGEQIKIENQTVIPNGTVLTILRDSRFPTIFVRLELDPNGQPVIIVNKNIKRSADSANETERFDIQVIAKAQDQYFYRIGGSDYTKESMSQAILVPLFTLI